jgi:hypothetical protein
VRFVIFHPSNVSDALRSSIWLALTLVACGGNPYWIGEIIDVPDTGAPSGSGGSLVSSGTGTNGGQGGSGGAAGLDSDGGGEGTPDAGLTDSPADLGSRPETGTVCEPGQCKRVFLSSSAPPSAGKLGGASAVDTFCQSAADAKQLGGTWRAWISDGNTTPTARFTHATVPYRLLDGTTVASGWSMLVGSSFGGGSLAHAIDVFEDGTAASAAVEVWTGTWTDGDWWGPDCNRWMDDTAGFSANVGLSNSSARGWTSANTQLCNHTDLHVYCFEQ